MNTISSMPNVPPVMTHTLQETKHQDAIKQEVKLLDSERVHNNNNPHKDYFVERELFYEYRNGEVKIISEKTSNISVSV
jgi:hypothetical protein